MKKLTQDFNSMILEREVIATELRQKMRALEQENKVLSVDLERASAKVQRLQDNHATLVNLIRYLTEKVNNNFKMYITEMLDKLEAQTEVSDMMNCIISCMEDFRVGDLTYLD